MLSMYNNAYIAHKQYEQQTPWSDSLSQWKGLGDRPGILAEWCNLIRYPELLKNQTSISPTLTLSKFIRPSLNAPLCLWRKLLGKKRTPTGTNSQEIFVEKLIITQMMNVQIITIFPKRCWECRTCTAYPFANTAPGMPSGAVLLLQFQKETRGFLFLYKTELHNRISLSSPRYSRRRGSDVI